MQCSKLAFMLPLVLLVVLSQLNFNRVTGLPWLAKSAEIEGYVLKEDEAEDRGRAAEELENLVNNLSKAMKQDAALLQEEEATPGRNKQDTNKAVDEQYGAGYGGYTVVQGHGPHKKWPKKVDRKLTKKVLKALRKGRERKKEEKMLSLHNLFLFQKPLTDASAMNFQDFVNYLKGVGHRIKDFFTKHPVMMQGASKDSVVNQDQSVAELEQKSDAQVQEIEEALIQEIFFNMLKSVARGRVTKRDVNGRDIPLQVLNGLSALAMQSDFAHHTKYSNGVIAKDEALKSIPDEKKKSSLPKLPTKGAALSIPYMGSSEDMPTVSPARETTLNQDTQEQN